MHTVLQLTKWHAYASRLNRSLSTCFDYSESKVSSCSEINKHFSSSTHSKPLLFRRGAETGAVPGASCNMITNMAVSETGTTSSNAGALRGLKPQPPFFLAGSLFWTRTALVMTLALSVMATALFVLRLYHAPVYEEATGLGHDLQDEITRMAALEMTAFIDHMAPVMLVLVSNLHHQGVTDAIANDPHNPHARKMLWDTFKAWPDADSLSYGTDRGAEIYIRPLAVTTPLLIEAKPEDLASPNGNWMARTMPVDPSLGEPLSTNPVPETPFIPYNTLPYHVAALSQPPGTVHWWTGPIRSETGDFLMYYIATCVLESTVTHRVPRVAESLLRGGNRGTLPSNDEGTLPSNDEGTLPSNDEGTLPSNDEGTLPSNDEGTLPSSEDNVDDVASIGAAAASKSLGVLSMAYSTRSLTKSLQRLQLRGGRLFFARTQGGTLIIANQGRLFITAKGAAEPSTITAEQSDDAAIAAAARHLRKTFSTVSSEDQGGDAGDDDRDRDAEEAAAAGLCWEAYKTMISIDGRPWYLHCQGNVYGGSSARLPMVGVLLIPRDAIMGRADASRHRSLVLVICVTIAIAALGLALVYVSTVHVGRAAGHKEALEGQVERQEGEMRVLGDDLLAIKTKMPRRKSRNGLELRTPMERVHDMLAALVDGQVGANHDAVATIQKLLRMPDPHMPILLQGETQDVTDGSNNWEVTAFSRGQPAGQDTQILDKDTMTWLRSTVMRLPSMSNIVVSPSGSPQRRHSMDTSDQASKQYIAHSYNGSRSSGIMERNLGMRNIRFEASSHGGSDATVPYCPIPGSPPGAWPSQLSNETPLLALRAVEGRMAAPGAADGFCRDGAVLTRDGPKAEEGDDEDVPAARRSGSLPGGTATGGSTTASSYLSPNDSSFSVEVVNGPAGGRGLMRSLLDKCGEWNFDAWELRDVSMGRPILWIGLEVLQRLSLVREFRLPVDQLERFLSALDDGMPANNYHNNVHIADVTNSLFHLLKHSGVGAYLTRLDMLALVTAALVHDFRHPGLNNDFVVRSSDELALRYNDRTVLESYHVAEAFILLRGVEHNFLKVLDQEDFKYVRRMVIEIVLASDLKRHFELVEAFKDRTKNKESPLSKSNEGDRLLLMQVALKVSDIGHSAKKLELHKRWTRAITEEFYLQGDKERAAGFKVSAFMDRENIDLPKGQLGFFSFIAFPLFQAWVAHFPDSQPILDTMLANIKYWEGLRDGTTG